MYQPMLSPSPAHADHAKQQAFTFNISSPTETHSPSSSPSNTPKQSRSTSRVRVCGDETIQPITNNFISEPMTRVRNHTVTVDATETQLKVPHSQSKRGSISLVDHDLTQSAIHSRKMCIRLPSNHIIMCDVQIAKKRFTTHVTWSLTGDIQHVIHLSHGTLFGTRKIYLDERSIHESRKLVDDGSSHSIFVDNEQHKLLVKIKCSHGHFEYILLVNGKPLVPASEAASIGVEVPMSP